MGTGRAGALGAVRVPGLAYTRGRCPSLTRADPFKSDGQSAHLRGAFSGVASSPTLHPGDKSISDGQKTALALILAAKLLGLTARGTMAAKWFRDDETGFADWCKSHTSGFVVNARYKPAREYLVLHKVGCATLRDRSGLTGPHYSKLCSDSIDQLLVEMRREVETKAFSKICQKCSPLTTG